MASSVVGDRLSWELRNPNGPWVRGEGRRRAWRVPEFVEGVPGALSRLRCLALGVLSRARQLDLGDASVFRCLAELLSEMVLSGYSTKMVRDVAFSLPREVSVAVCWIGKAFARLHASSRTRWRSQPDAFPEMARRGRQVVVGCASGGGTDAGACAGGSGRMSKPAAAGKGGAGDRGRPRGRHPHRRRHGRRPGSNSSSSTSLGYREYKAARKQEAADRELERQARCVAEIVGGRIGATPSSSVGPFAAQCVIDGLTVKSPPAVPPPNLCPKRPRRLAFSLPRRCLVGRRWCPRASALMR